MQVNPGATGDRQIYERLRAALKERRPAVLATVVESADRSLLAQKALFLRTEDEWKAGPSSFRGEIGLRLLEQVRAHISEGGLSIGQEGKRVRVVSFDDVAASVAVETFAPQRRLVIAGGGHIAAPTHDIAATVGFSVTVIDDRPAFASEMRFPKASKVICADFEKAISSIEIDALTSVVVVTRGHLHDLEALRALIGKEPAYIGMIGSRRRVLTVFERLRSLGAPEAFLERIYSPIGLDIGAETPEEIALAIVSEIVCALNGRTGSHLRRTLPDAAAQRSAFAFQDVVE